MKSDDLVVGNFNGFPFMVFFIPRAGREQRPVYRTQNPYNGTFKRNYEGDYKCTEKEVQRILPKPFKLENNIRKDETPAHVAVREALINFIVHADYSENASLIARVYKNRIVLSNPGTMLVSKQQYYNGGDSVCRNKALQTMFLILGSAEKAGSGVDKILKGWREQNWRSPILETKCQPDKVELTMRMESVMDENIKNQLVSVYGEQILNIGHDRLLVLNMVVADGFVTNESLRYMLNIHKASIVELLKNMCNSGLLVAEGYGRGTKYKLPNMATSDANVATSDANVATPDVNNRIKMRMKSEELERLIKNTCQDWISLDELASAICRSPKYLRSRIIPNLIENNTLEMMFPTIPNHPKQKYKLKEK